MNPADAAMLGELASAIAGRQVTLTEDALRGALDPDLNIARRATPGGPAPAEVRRMIAARRASLTSAQERAGLRRERDRQARERLARAAADLTG
jgi:argininosuccinate lyase